MIRNIEEELVSARFFAVSGDAFKHKLTDVEVRVRTLQVRDGHIQLTGAQVFNNLNAVLVGSAPKLGLRVFVDEQNLCVGLQPLASQIDPVRIALWR